LDVPQKRRGSGCLFRQARRSKEGCRSCFAQSTTGVKVENCYWIRRRRSPRSAPMRGGVEVRPNETDEVMQPWHWVVIPAMGLTMGKIFYLEELAEDCAQDGVYDFFFAGPPVVITGGTGSPINSLAIK
jgi:hypothetical protein